MLDEKSQGFLCRGWWLAKDFPVEGAVVVQLARRYLWKVVYQMETTLPGLRQLAG